MRVKITSAFKKDLKRARKSGKNMEILDTVLGQIQNQCLDSKWKDHPLVGHWVPHHELHLSSDWLLIYRIEGDALILSRLGSHSELLFFLACMIESLRCCLAQSRLSQMLESRKIRLTVLYP